MISAEASRAETSPNAAERAETYGEPTVAALEPPTVGLEGLPSPEQSRDVAGESCSGGAACSCLRVYYDPVRHDDGTLSEWWGCEACGAEFVRASDYAVVCALHQRLDDFVGNVADAYAQHGNGGGLGDTPLGHAIRRALDALSATQPSEVADE